MTQYNTLNVKLFNSQLNGTDVTLNLSSNLIGNSNDETNFPDKLLLTNSHVSKLVKGYSGLKIFTSSYYSFTCLYYALSVNVLPNMLAANVPNKIELNPPFCSFGSFLIDSLTPFISNHDSSSDLTIFIISSISSLEIINVPDP